MTTTKALCNQLIEDCDRSLSMMARINATTHPGAAGDMSELMNTLLTVRASAQNVRHMVEEWRRIEGVLLTNTPEPESLPIT